MAAVEHYLKNKTTLENTASKFHIHYQTLFKWIKRYKEDRETGLLASYYKPWNRMAAGLEDKIAAMKEEDPSITVREAKHKLMKQGMDVSLKGIWGAWKRFGYAGFKKERLGPDFTEYCSWTKEAQNKFNQAQELVKLGKHEESAKILNTIPMLPRNDIVIKIPDRFLNLRRRVEKVATQYKMTPISSYYARVRDLYKECLDTRMKCLALRAKIFEIGALSFTGRPALLLASTEELKKLLARKGDYYSSLLFPSIITCLLSEGIACAQLSDIKNAAEISKKCYYIIKRRKHLPFSLFYELGALCTWIEDFKKAEHCFTKALEEAPDSDKETHKRNLGFVLFHKGDYKRSLQFLKRVTERGWGYDPKILLCEAIRALVKGMPDDSLSYCTRALSLFKKDELNIGIINAYQMIASAYCGLGQKAKAASVLKRLLPFARENFQRQAGIFEDITASLMDKKVEDAQTEHLFPTAKLVRLLKLGEYTKAYAYADRKYLVSDLHQFSVFFGEKIAALIQKGRPTHLPRSMLNLPIFNKTRPVYYMKFLGPLNIYRNDQHIKTKLPPREGAFAIHFSLRAGDPGKRMFCSDLYENFWRRSPNPSRNLSHLMMKVKKKLKIPAHQLVISHQEHKPNLSNRGMHFITDYDEFKQLIAAARAFQRAGKWTLASKEFQRAFALFRGEPFRKMYDEWSSQTRAVVLDDLETNAIHFAESCLQNADRNRMKKVLGRIVKIIPHSHRLKGFLASTT